MSDATDAYVYHAEGRAEGRPLVFVFHGTGGTESQFVPLVRELMPGAAIVAPRGDVSEHGALRFFRRLGEGRYDMEDLARRTAAMADFVEAHVAAGRPSRGDRARLLERREHPRERDLRAAGAVRRARC